MSPTRPLVARNSGILARLAAVEPSLPVEPVGDGYPARVSAVRRLEHEPRFRADKPTPRADKTRFASTVTCSCGEFSKAATSTVSADAAKGNARRRWMKHLDEVETAAAARSRRATLGCAASLMATALVLVVLAQVLSWGLDKAFPDYCYTQTGSGHIPDAQARHVCDGRPHEVPESVVR